MRKNIYGNILNNNKLNGASYFTCIVQRPSAPSLSVTSKLPIKMQPIERDTAALSTRILTQSMPSSQENTLESCHDSSSEMLVESSTARQLSNMAETPSQIMQTRWLQELENRIPAMDMEDVRAVLANPQASRQFAAEHSQSSYREMLSHDEAIGDYIRSNKTVQFSYSDRERLISIIQDLHKKKEYKQETLHLAGSIADRYLKILITEGQELTN